MKLKGGFTTEDPRLDRLKQRDERSRSFPVAEVLPAKKPRSYTWNFRKGDPQLDQGREGACVSTGWGHELACAPVMVPGITMPFCRERIYWPAQRIDPWEGGSYEGACVDMNTQALCRTKGWVGPDRLQVGDEILAFDLEGQGLRWTIVTHVNQYKSRPYRVFVKGTFAIGVTDNHQWVAHPSDSEMPFGLVETAQLTGHYAVPLAAPLLDLPDKVTYEDDFVELVAWAVTEGYFRPSSRRGTGITIRQKHHKGRVADLMARLGVARGHLPKDGCHQWELSGVLSKAVREVAPNGEPNIDWLTKLSARQLRLFISACVWADGHRKPGVKAGYKDSQTFCQKPGGVLDAFLAACVLAGIPVSRESIHEVSGCEIWTLRAKERAVYTDRRIVSPYVLGPVWCPTTELGTFVARRNRSIWITGNSPQYEGTSVLAGAKVVQKELGLIKEYRWGFSLEDVLLALGYLGPVVLGLDWYAGMMQPGSDGFIRPTGSVVGGHCIVARGVNHRAKRVLVRNSWGPRWGADGDCYISFDDLGTLLSQGGDACIPSGRTTA